MNEPFANGPAAPVRLVLQGREVACRAIIFDKDGTLVDPTGAQSRLTRLKALRAAAEASQGSLQGASPSQPRRQGDGRAGVSADPGGFGGPQETKAAPRAQAAGAAPFVDDDGADLDSWTMGPGLLPGVDQMLSTFESLGLRMAVATGDRRQRAQATLDALGVSSHFQAIVGIDDVLHGKPAPDMVHMACDLLGCLPEEVIVVGDSSADLMMGRAAGVAACIGVSGPFRPSPSLGALADLILSTAAELPDLLLQG